MSKVRVGVVLLLQLKLAGFSKVSRVMVMVRVSVRIWAVLLKEADNADNANNADEGN